MPYMMISTLIRLETGPTYVGDAKSDPVLMNHLEATLTKEPGQIFEVYRTPLLPREVLNRLEKKGWKVIAVTGVGETCIWTLHRV
ncbi:GTP cyclohydrolase 1 feedback regulatory protein-like isoform X1 [Oratosquilla oratoria]|uniref:GTP cyclohydrolase 1 feedback regulatory protein-like isoform X1 n=1 Tax=Oratosquilla oratoria TaxID=337810 RepID=UPI003F764580